MHYTVNLIVLSDSARKYKVSVFFGIQIGYILSVWRPETGCGGCDSENAQFTKMKNWLISGFKGIIIEKIYFLLVSYDIFLLHLVTLTKLRTTKQSKPTFLCFRTYLKRADQSFGPI